MMTVGRITQLTTDKGPLPKQITALPPVRSEPLFSISRFRSVLVKHGIIFPEAIEDAEGFDGERTLAATRAAYDELMENNAVRVGGTPYPPRAGSPLDSEGCR
jgi:hypothetical protein